MPRVEIDRLRERLEMLYRQAGLDERRAEIVTEIIIDTEAAGRTTHGLIRVGPQLKQLERDGHREGEWLLDEPGRALYDGRNGLGYLIGYELAEKAISMLDDSHTAVVGCRGATHTGPIGWFARRVALAGHVSIWFANCSPLAAPHGAVEPVLGTNPITFGLPRSPEPIVADMATTATTFGDCKVAMAEGRSIPEGHALDSAGNPTVDPEEALRGGCLRTFGEHKGYALSVAVQLLSSALCGGPAIPDPRTDYGLSAIALRRDILVDPALYDRITGELVSVLKSARPEDPDRPVRLPGERSTENRERAERDGIEISDKLYDEIFGD